jgi:hypothetical protein
MKKLIFGTLTMLALSPMFAGSMTVQASVNGGQQAEYQGKTGFLPELSEFKVDIEESKKTINNSLNTAKPLRESFHHAIGEIKGALTAVKHDRNPDTQRKLHEVFSSNIIKIEKRMVGVTKEKYRIKDSFKEIDREFMRVNHSLNEKKQKFSNDMAMNSKKIKKLQKESGELARRYLESPSDELKNKLDDLKKEMEYLNYGNQQIPGQSQGIEKALTMLGKRGTFYHRLGNNVDELLEKLDIQRQKFASVAEVYNMLVGISETTWSSTGDATPAEWYAQVDEVWTIVDSFTSIMDEVTDELLKVSDSSAESLEIVVMRDDNMDEWIRKQAEVY